MSMPDVSYYRIEAARCRALAEQSPVADMAKRWRALAADYDKLAEALESAHMPLARTQTRQPMQQQQTKAEDEK